MFCAHCGKPVQPWQWRCGACRKATPVLLRHELALVLVAVAGFAFYFLQQVLEIWRLLDTGLEQTMPWFLAYAYLLSRLTASYAPWVAALYIVAALLLRRRLGGLFGSGRPAIWLAGLFALAVLGMATAGAIAGATNSPDLASHERYYRSAYLDSVEQTAVREVMAAQESYKAAHRPPAYGCDLATLHFPPAQKAKEGAEFDLFVACGDAQGRSYRVLARPTASATRPMDLAYCADESGTVYSARAGAMPAARADAIAACLRGGRRLDR